MSNRLSTIVVAQLFPGMEFQPLILLFFCVSAGLGVVAIFFALQRAHSRAQCVGRWCIVLALGSTTIWLLVLGRQLMPSFYPFAASPMALGFFAVWISKKSRDKPPLPPGSVSLGSMLFLLTVVAAGAALVRFHFAGKYQQKYEAERPFRQYEELMDVEAIGSVFDGYFRAAGVQFRIRGRPNSLISLRLTQSLDRFEGGAIDEELEKFEVSQIGSARPLCVMSDAYGERHGGLEFGTDGSGNQLVPFKIESIQDLLQNYDKLEHELMAWPSPLSPKTISIRTEIATDIMKYHVEIEEELLSNQVERDRHAGGE